MLEASLSTFRIIAIQGYTHQFYMYFDSTGYVAAIYFPLVVIIGNFFLLKLFLAVIMETFSELHLETVYNPKD